jgi:hypothetical protein
MLTPSNQVSLSACADLQRAWEGPRGSLTEILCEFLGKPVFCSNVAFLCYGGLRLTEMINDPRKAAFAIIRNSNVPCQVRHSSPSYGRLCLSNCIYTFFSYQLHANCRALHEYTLQERKRAARGEGPGFDGELNNFQTPQLSGLARLVSILLFCYGCLWQVSDNSE